jgi:hypothetical protein
MFESLLQEVRRGTMPKRYSGSHDCHVGTEGERKWPLLLRRVGA